MRVVVYDKGGDAAPPLPATLIAEHHLLENIGLESHTYLHHIVSSYDTLAEKTVFAQGAPPTAGFHGHKRGGGHLLPDVDFAYDYLCPCTKSLYLPSCARERLPTFEMLHALFLALS